MPRTLYSRFHAAMARMRILAALLFSSPLGAPAPTYAAPIEAA